MLALSPYANVVMLTAPIALSRPARKVYIAAKISGMLVWAGARCAAQKVSRCRPFTVALHDAAGEEVP